MLLKPYVPGSLRALRCGESYYNSSVGVFRWNMSPDPSHGGCVPLSV